MKMILCLDDNNGMLFNDRRQSRDRALIEDVFNNLIEEKLNVFEFSKTLFSEYEDKICIVNELVNDGIYFVENLDVTPFLSNITEVIVYKWNRVYPADFYCEIDFSASFFIAEQTDFKGSSHEKITRIVWRKK